MDTSVASEPFAHLDKEHNLCSLQLLWYVLTDFMHTYCSHERMQSKLLLPILTGLYYLFSHKELLSFSWDTSSVYPISQSSFLNSIQSFINEVRSTDWSSFTFHDIKLLLSYNSSEFPFAVTHLNSLSCLNGMKVPVDAPFHCRKDCCSYTPLFPHSSRRLCRHMTPLFR